MALFFDQEWFDAELARLHMRREDFGAMLGLEAREVAELWKDQRELQAADVALIAALFNKPPEEIARHAGISTPVPVPRPAGSDALMARLDAIEAKLDLILKRLS